MAELTETEREMLDFEGQWFKYAGTRETEIRDRFGIDTVTYAQRVLALIRRPEALEYAPMTVRRMARLRDARRGQRVRA